MHRPPKPAGLLSDTDLVREAVALSGLSVEAFAREVMAGRDERTIRRWRSGEQDVPPRVREWLEAWVEARRDERE